ncbi:MAG: hypothetical protein COC19_07455 [SAR86 cluster bacterium]|uniref:HTH luxR-type domain-containing protein n=1 Tax=SAR86 cluster bacterium TaxID=2030880 RepID=A0A2A4MGX0_9GAMM|nr:MAG: hypothetical protein COC19_07455 [SAR86 cluster bacterium]
MLAWLDLPTALLLLSLTFCTSLTVGGLLLLFRASKDRRPNNFQSLQYFLICMYVFGYYGLWSQLILARYLPLETAQNVSGVVAVLATPFLLIGEVMLLGWAISQLKQPPRWLFMASLAFIIGLASVCYSLIPAQPHASVTAMARPLVSLMTVFITALVAVILITPFSNNLNQPRARGFLALIALSGVIHLSQFSQLADMAYFETLFAFAFFFSNTAAVLVYIYSADFKPTDSAKRSASPSAFFSAHQISPREIDIVKAIAAGKTNQQIADQLHISLQTVKDHCSRIYQKVQVRNHTQLANLFRDSLR